MSRRSATGVCSASALHSPSLSPLPLPSHCHLIAITRAIAIAHRPSRVNLPRYRRPLTWQPCGRLARAPRVRCEARPSEGAAPAPAPWLLGRLHCRLRRAACHRAASRHLYHRVRRKRQKHVSTSTGEGLRLARLRGMSMLTDTRLWPAHHTYFSSYFLFLFSSCQAQDKDQEESHDQQDEAARGWRRGRLPVPDESVSGAEKGHV